MNGSQTLQDGYRIRAVVRASDILEVLRKSRGGASLNELASGTGIAKASVFRMARTLEETGLVERVPGTESYRIGVRCLQLGQAYLEQTDLRQEARPILERLKGEFGETVHLGVLDDEHRIVYIEKLETQHAVGLMMSMVGKTSQSFCTGLGKTLLASIEEVKFDSVLESLPLRRYTVNTIFEPEALRRELNLIRKQGYATDLEEHEPGVHCVAAPIVDGRGNTVAAVSVSGPAERLPEKVMRGELASAIRSSAAEISQRLGAV